MTIRELIEKLKEYGDVDISALYKDGLNMPVIGIDGHKISIGVKSAEEVWTDGGDPYSYYVLNPYGSKEVLVIE